MEQFNYKTMNDEDSGSNVDYGSFSNTCTPSPEHTGPGGQGTSRGIAPNDNTIMAGDQYQKAPLTPGSSSGSEENVVGDKHMGELRQDKKRRVDFVSPDVNIDVEDADQPMQYPAEPVKTLLAGLFLLFGFLCSMTGLALTHERVPPTVPLPDIVLDNLPYKQWALKACNVIIIISTSTAFIVIMLHTHRLIILRRVFLMLGLLYVYRAITMYITVLPNPDPLTPCAPLLNQTSFTDVVDRILTISSGGGLSLSLSGLSLHVYCGDYIFSGHTVMLTMGYMAITDYSPRHWFLLHWGSLTCTCVGVLFLLLQRVHYSIDVVLAYWITSRLWYLYHTVAHNQQLKQRGGHNFLDRIWWWRIFIFFEGNVPGPLPKEYSLPLPEKLMAFVSKRRTKSQ